MAGSYGHVTEDDGSLSSGERINGMLECMSGDVTECVEEMYGMIWYLAMNLSLERSSILNEGAVKDIIKDAVENHKQGLIYSPTKEYTAEYLAQRSW